ncbi:MAG: hypothetical protein ACKVPX_15020 [Myxococcaceae bacterium]
MPVTHISVAEDHARKLEVRLTGRDPRKIGTRLLNFLTELRADLAAGIWPDGKEDLTEPPSPSAVSDALRGAAAGFSGEMMSFIGMSLAHWGHGADAQRIFFQNDQTLDGFVLAPPTAGTIDRSLLSTAACVPAYTSAANFPFTLDDKLRKELETKLKSFGYQVVAWGTQPRNPWSTHAFLSSAAANAVLARHPSPDDFTVGP